MDSSKTIRRFSTSHEAWSSEAAAGACVTSHQAQCKGAEMKQNDTGQKPALLLKTALVAGLSGGIAEIVWVGLYCYLTGLSSSTVAREIAASVSSDTGYPTAALFGGVIHIALSLAISVIYALAIWRPFASQFDPIRSVTIAVVVLATIWFINFFLLLPVLNPVFISLMPYPVTLASKILFGLSMGSTFEYARAWRPVTVETN
jgi:hypothetical protein